MAETKACEESSHLNPELPELNRTKGFLGKTLGEVTAAAPVRAHSTLAEIRALDDNDLLIAGVSAMQDIGDNLLVLDELRQRFRNGKSFKGYSGWADFVSRHSRYSMRTVQKKLADHGGKDLSKVNVSPGNMYTRKPESEPESEPEPEPETEDTFADAVPIAALTLEENFLTASEADEFEEACKGLEFTRRSNPRDPKKQIRNINILWSDVLKTHAEKSGIPCRPLSDAPEIIQKIVARLSARLGRTVNYVSLMGYEGGTDHLSWHQHREDYNHDTPVAIVSTGAVRDLSYGEFNGKTKKRGFNAPRVKQHVTASRGSLIILPSSFNNTHVHAVLNDKRVTGTRYSMNCKCMDDVYYGVASEPEPVYMSPSPSKQPVPFLSRSALLDDFPENILFKSGEDVPVAALLTPASGLSDTGKLKALFEGLGVLVKASTAKDGLVSCEGKYNLIGLTMKQVRKIAEVLK